VSSLSDSFDDFLNYETEVFDRIETRYDEETREKAASNFESQIPKGPLERQVEWVKSRLYEVTDQFSTDIYENPILNQIRSSVEPLEGGEDNETVHNKPKLVENLDQYDAVVLDHCVAFSITEKSSNKYYSDGREESDWEDVLNFVDEASRKSEVYVPSDLVRKSDRNKFLGQKQAVKLFVEGFNTLNMAKSYEVPHPHLEHLREDLLIGSLSESKGKNVLISSFDSDMGGAVEHHYDIDSAWPLLKED